MIRHDALGAEFLEQTLGEKDRHDRSGEGRNRGPGNCCPIATGSATEERSDSFKIVVRAVGVSQQHRGQHQQDDQHTQARAELFRQADDTAGDAATGVSHRLTSIVDLFMNDHTASHNGILAPIDRDVVHG